MESNGPKTFKQFFVFVFEKTSCLSKENMKKESCLEIIQVIKQFQFAAKTSCRKKALFERRVSRNNVTFLKQHLLPMISRFHKHHSRSPY
ncbi:CLUMA_CG010402, isoform A [Clunio marinus]|uniref:CLUMA_CG010402, isoform A n=1 Tax=Clunio marinus TaxID=568069 RepID=A0A1J1IB64_9DIPT|nr:CLUMA_CG010402, isoform A [Clunio marinus]